MCPVMKQNPFTADGFDTIARRIKSILRIFISGGVPKLRKGPGFPLILRHKARLRRLQRGNRFNPSPNSRLQVTGCRMPVC